MRWFHGNVIFECEDFKRLGKITGDCCDCLVPTIPSQQVNKDSGLDWPHMSWVRILVCCKHIHAVRTISYGWWESEKIRLKKEDPRFNTSLPGYTRAKSVARAYTSPKPGVCIVCKAEPIVEKGVGQKCLDLLASLKKGVSGTS